MLSSHMAPCRAHTVQSCGFLQALYRKPHLAAHSNACYIPATGSQDSCAPAGLKLRTLSRKWSGMSAGGEGTWVVAFEDLQRAPSAKLFPLVRVLLQADSLTETGDAATRSALAPGKVGVSRGLSLDSGLVRESLESCPAAPAVMMDSSKTEPGNCAGWSPAPAPLLPLGLVGSCGSYRVLPRRSVVAAAV